jgi:hypothetical protein
MSNDIGSVKGVNTTSHAKNCGKGSAVDGYRDGPRADPGHEARPEYGASSQQPTFASYRGLTRVKTGTN